jgi:hypothetical protein
VTINTERVATLTTLAKGAHDSPDDGMCLLEAVSWIAGERWSDHPSCASVVLGTFGRNLNDALPAETRQQLIPLAPQIVGTAGDGLDETRSYMALDWLIRTYTPAWLDLAGLTAEAQALRDLRRIVDLVSAQDAGPVVRDGRDKAEAKWSAARAAARSAAGYAAGYAAGAAAGAAAGSAARAAAGSAALSAAGSAALSAAESAARSAARAAARSAAAEAALAPTVTDLQQSAIELFTAMIHPAVTK